MRRIFCVLLFCIVFASVGFAQAEEKFDFYTRGPYNESVPRPQSILRFDVGDHHTTYAQMEQVIFAIQKAAPDRVKIIEIGTTNEHRMQYLVAISSPENIARLDYIKASIARLADPRVTSASEASNIAANMPAVAWMAYTIHGNESASFEAMMQVIYQLAASNEPATLDVLKNTVTLVLTGENPDGHERFVSWYNSVAIGDPDRNAIEHSEPWSVYGRLSHYRFDLNRDTLAITQKETRNMQAAFMEWNPQVSVDHHGQPEQFFFPPVALPINPNLPQPDTNKWYDIYGRANAAAFDKNLWDYYVRDVFDAFYPGYWDTYPSLNGAIGMTYETDGGGFKGLRWRRRDGTIVTLRSATAKHYVASLTTLEQTARHKVERLKDFYAFRADAMKSARSAKMQRVVIDPSSDRVKAAELVETLLRSKIEVKRANASFSSRAAHTYMQKNAPAASKTFAAGSYVIDLDQPQRLLIKSILEQNTPQDKAFVDDNMARFRRNQLRGSNQEKEDYGFYDITAWSLPLAFGVDAYWTEDAGSVDSTAMTMETAAAAMRGSVSGRASVAYIVPYETDSTGAFIARMLQKGVRVAVSTRRLNAGSRNWPEGTFVIRVSRNGDSVHDTVARAAAELGVNVTAINSGYPEEGDTGIGGEAVIPLRAPRIAVIADDGVDQTSYGSIWWTFDRYGIRFTPIAANRSFDDYNVLILPNGSSGRYARLFGASGISRLKAFAQRGGTIITVGGASVFAAQKDTALTSAKIVGSDNDEPNKGRKKDGENTEPAASPTPDSNVPLPAITSPSAEGNSVPVYLPGSIMRATVDRTVPLNYGIHQNEIPVILSGNDFFTYSEEGTNAVVFEKNSTLPLTVSGFVWEGNTEELLAGTAYVIDEPTGGGHVILFVEEPFFRGIFRSATKQFINSVIFNGAL